MKSLIAKTYKSLFKDHGVFELRVPKTENGVVSGFFGPGGGTEFLKAVESLDGKVPSVYITLNPVKPELLERNKNKIVNFANRNVLTSDADIQRRALILVDVDPKRKADMASSDDEKKASYDVAIQIKEYLSNQGFPDPFVADSGNGFHLLYKCDLQNTDEVTDAVHGFLKYLHSNFSTEIAHVDTKVSNASRIVKLYGTMSTKGDNSPERPHRRSELLECPKDDGFVTLAMLLANQFVEPVKEKKPTEIVKHSSGNRKYVLSALDDAIQKVQSAPSGQRNDTLNSQAFCIAQFVGSGELSEQLAWSSLSDAAERNGLETNEVDATLRSAFEKGKAQPRYAPEVKQRQMPQQAPEMAAESIDPETGEITPHRGSQEAWMEFCGSWVYVEATKSFINLKTMRQLSVEAFNMTHAALLASYAPEAAGKRPNAALYLMKDLIGESVHNTMYLPTMWNGNPIFEIDGIKYLNTYNDIWTPKTDENWQKHDAWQICEQHLKNILPEDWQEILMFMAHNVQYPGKKILWAPIIVGIQGDGKTVLAKMMAAAMGAKNTKVVGLQATRSEFNSWAEGSCLAVFEEIRAPGHSRHDFMNKLKELITNDVIDVVAKGRDGRNVVNTQNYMALSNFKDALAIDEHDRRWGVFFTKFKDHKQVVSTFDSKYWEMLNDYAIKGFPEVIRGWLMSVDLSGFNRNARPKATDAKASMMQSSLSDGAQSVLEAISLGGQGLSKEIISTKYLNEALLNIDGSKVNTSRLSRALESIGYKKGGVVKWKGWPHSVWVKDDIELTGLASDSYILRDLLDKTAY